MLILTKKEENEDNIVYNYYPENGEKFGTLKLSRENGNIQVIKVSDNDPNRRYLCHAVAKIDEFFETKKYEDCVTLAWY